MFSQLGAGETRSPPVRLGGLCIVMQIVLNVRRPHEVYTSPSVCRNQVKLVLNLEMGICDFKKNFRLFSLERDGSLQTILYREMVLFRQMKEIRKCNIIETLFTT